ncbi:MAG TPA: mandelate racemase/muconate lactonizing enzyme family protein [Casimicrobiaceae bacterium]|nr:mandelate racemase/muconate lactonizing enzyme family protein [Casimicrobiaceae bacterium]
MFRSDRLAIETCVVSTKTRWVFIRIERDDGRVGVGEATLNGREGALLAAAADFTTRALSHAVTTPAEFAAGVTPRDLVQATVVSAIDCALWDLHAQDAGVPLVEALGGARHTSIPAYANINRRTLDRTPRGFAQSARDALAAGFHAIKIAPFDEVSIGACARGDASALIQAGIARIAAVRDVCGPDRRLMVDCHWRFDEANALRAIDAAVELNVHWIECPLPEARENVPALVNLRRHANSRGVLLAGMEQGVGSEDFRPYCAAGAYDVMMPDVKYVGGFDEMLRCARLLQRHGVAVSLHNPSGPVAHAASLHVCAALDRFDLLELQFDESPLFDRFVSGLPPRIAGSSMLPGGSGLGVQLDQRLVNSHRDPPLTRIFEA